ncbi:hypothetical protein [Thalassobius sp. I31.1]|uniref:hypothetical protein n=1 Tax=Thalassobius sp. I31.1 TaxID=2109912 RepID=UPI000D1ACDE1|nr:hypothetical protein [Thalassobius sp. I31.1]
MNDDLLMNIQTYSDLHAWEIGEELLTPLFLTEKLKPQKVATFGEVTAKHGFAVESLVDCKPYWGTTATMRVAGTKREIFEDFNWKRNRVAKSQGMVTFPSNNMKGTRLSGGLFFEAKFKRDIDWIRLFKTSCQVVSSYAGVLHVVTQHDRPKRIDRTLRELTDQEEITEAAWSRFAGGSFFCEFRAGELNSLVSGLTNLGWASWFGGELAKEVDEAAISDAGFPIEKVGDSYLIQVTESIDDVINDFPMFSRRRMELKSLFRNDLFLIKDEPVLL